MTGCLPVQYSEGCPARIHMHNLHPYILWTKGLWRSLVGGAEDLFRFYQPIICCIPHTLVLSEGWCEESDPAARFAEFCKTTDKKEKDWRPNCARTRKINSKSDMDFKIRWSLNNAHVDHLCMRYNVLQVGKPLSARTLVSKATGRDYSQPRSFHFDACTGFWLILAFGSWPTN